jgi:hypothetical protein
MSVEAFIRIRMKSTWTRNPPLEDRPQMVLIWLPPLTAPAQNMPPVTAKLFAEPRKHRQVTRYSVVSVIAVHHPFQPRSDALHRLVHHPA